MDDDRESAALGGPGVMLLSAAIFGYFGFFTHPATRDATGQLVPSWFLLKWTLMGSAVAFAVSAGVTFASRRGGNLLYGVCGIASAVLFVVVLVMDIVDKQHAAAIGPVLLAIFAAWNGYGAWTGLAAVLGSRRSG